MASMDEADCTLQLEAVRDAAAQDSEYQLLKTNIKEGFPDAKRGLDPAIREYWCVREASHFSDDGFILYG